MSAFLGPIHYWLYAKIKHVQNRTARLADAASENCNSLADSCLATVYETYGEPPSAEKDLAELIDPTNIHGWLARQIQLTEAREAALLKELNDCCGDGVWELATKVFTQEGARLGETAMRSGRYDLQTAGGLYKAFHDTFLSGMPCDGGFEEVSATDQQIILERASCPKPTLWLQIGVSVEAMQELYRQWLFAFVAALNPAFAVSQQISDGKQRLIIARK